MKCLLTKAKKGWITLFGMLTMIMALFATSISYAAQTTVIVQPNTVISSSTKFDNVILDMSNGSFIIKNKAILTIVNSNIKGTLSKNNPLLFNVQDGLLAIKNTKGIIKTSGLSAHPLTQSLEYVIWVAMGGVNLQGNSFAIDKDYTAGFLITTSSIPTTGLQVINNKFERFHGVLYLINSDDAIIADNILTRNSFGNIVLVGNDGKIIHNTIRFSGNNRLGNAMDIINSDNIEISQNILLTPTCHGIYVLNAHHLKIDSNRVSGGITYAINVLTYPETVGMSAYLKEIATVKTTRGLHSPALIESSDITITNNFMSQNRYGVAASNVNGLVVKNNIFIQRFVDKDARKFWTNNAILLTDVTNLTWKNNLYKEAFTQEALGDNSKSFHFVTFPITGGITLQ